MIPEKIRNKIKKIRVIYSDVDGTFVHNGCLFCNKKGYTMKNAEAIFSLLTAGVDIVMTSGREKEKLKDTARILGFQNYIANLGIEIVYNQGKKVINNYGIDVPNPKSLKSWIESSGVTDTIFKKFPNQALFYKPWSDILRTHLLLIGELNINDLTDFMEKNYPKLRIIDNGAVPPYENFNHPHAYHIVPKNVGKKAAVQIDKKERGLKRENLIGIGDSMEDVTIADEVAVFFLLDKSIQTTKENVVPVSNEDSEGFSRIVNYLKNNKFI